MASKKLELKLAELPKSPGVYFHKSKKGEIIYVGKAANLRNRVRQYFQKSRARDNKTELLVNEISDVDWQTVESEIDALFLEAELIRRYMPRYNILLRDNKSMVYVRIDYNSEHPTVTLTRRPLDDRAKYFGPYLNAYSIGQALKLLRKIFPYSTGKKIGQKRASLHYHIGLDPGLEDSKTSLKDYRANLRKLMAVLDGKRKKIESELTKDMKRLSRDKNYEAAAKARNQLYALQNLGNQVIFSDREFLDISKDHALSELVELLSLSEFPRRIEGYDISHMSGTNVVASMVVFTNGVSNKGEYRKFKTSKNQNNDFANMNETITRRFRPQNIKNWGLPNLVLIDGGKGQLEAAISARDKSGHKDIPFIGLAKRQETIIIDKQKSNAKPNLEFSKISLYSTIVKDSEIFIEVNFPFNSNLLKLLQRIRDESHRFAVSYHTVLKTKQQTNSWLDAVPGVGPATRKKLIKNFGSARATKLASLDELSGVVGVKTAQAILNFKD